MNKMTGKEMGEMFSDFVNLSTHDKEEFAETVCTQHRFLQQEMFNAMMKCIEGWADTYKSGYYDPRNEYAVKASHAMIEGLKAKELW